MTANNLDYYRRRAEEEQAAAEQAGHPSIAQVHRDMARLYRDLLDSEAGRGSEGDNMVESMGGSVAEPGTAYG